MLSLLKHSSRLAGLCAGLALLEVPLMADAAPDLPVTIPPDHSALAYTGFAELRVTPDAAAWRRIVTDTAPGYTEDAPGGVVRISLPAACQGGPHTCAVVLPYADAVRFRGLRLPAGATLLPLPPEPPRPRYVAYGLHPNDHGFQIMAARLAAQLAPIIKLSTPEMKGEPHGF